MPKKEDKPKKKIKQTLSQKEKFIAYAKEVECDESGEEFTRAMKKLAKKQVQESE